MTSRKQAKEQGLTRYFTGKPCKNGHICERVTCGGNCVECVKLYPCVKAAKRKYKKSELGREADSRYENSRKGQEKRRQRLDSDRYRERRRLHQIFKRSDPLCRISKNLRNRLNLAFKRQGTKKSTRTFSLTGCTFKELVEYLESKFLPGMTIDNYGEWEIDHIVPCVSFNLSDLKQQTKCFHYTNLQPLWKKDHILKSIRERDWGARCSNF